MSLKEIIAFDQKRYFEKIVKISKKQRELRDRKNKNLIQKVQYLYLTRERNRLAPKRNIWLQGKIGNNTKIYHANVIVNQFAKVGDACVFHGNNCLGNNGKDDKACPVLGNNVELGYGAMIIGNVKIADNVIVGAGAVVTKSFLEEGDILIGVPAKSIRQSGRKNEMNNTIIALVKKGAK